MTQVLQQNRWHWLQLPLVALVVGVGVFAVAQTTFEDLFEIARELNEDAKASQARIDNHEAERSGLVHEYRVVLKAIDGQKIYNRQVQLVVNQQLDQIAILEKSIEDVASIQRAITPLMLRMIEVLDDFVRLDLPFFLDVRIDRIDKLRDMMDNPNILVSEKFSQVLRAYQIESEYGRTIDASPATIEVDGEERNVDLLRIGRISLSYQTSDGKETGWWNPESQQWEVLNDSYTIPIRNGLKIASKQRTQGLMRVPVHIPEPDGA